MNVTKTVLKLTAAVATVAGIAYLVVKNIDTITNWVKNLCPKCSSEPVAEEEDFADEAPVQEPAAEAPAAEESAPIPEGEPVADESDFEA